MLVTVIKSFPYSVTGHSSVMLPTGEHEIRDVLIPGLIADGYVDGAGHDEVALTPTRRAAIIERLIAVGRAQMEAAPDTDLLKAARHLDEEQQARAAAEAEAAAAEAEAAAAKAAAAPKETAPITDADLLDAATDDELADLYKAKVGHKPRASMKRDAILAALKA